MMSLLNKFLSSIAIFCFLWASLIADSTAFERQEIPEKVARGLDVILANEIYSYDSNTEMCPVSLKEPNPIPCRLAFLQLLSYKGFESGDIVLMLFDAHYPKFKADLNAFERLHQLAIQGDKSALCLSSLVLSKIVLDDRSEWPYNTDTEFVFAKKGVELGLPVCDLVVSYAFEHGSHGYQKDLVTAHEMRLKAAKAGVYQAQLEVVEYFLDQGISDPNHPIKKLSGESLPPNLEEIIEEIKNYKPNYTLIDPNKVRIAYCWARVADRHAPGSEYHVKTRIEYIANKNGVLEHPEYFEWTKQWEASTYPFKPTAEDCPI